MIETEATEDGIQFYLDKPPEWKTFHEPGTVQPENTRKSNLKDLEFNLEDDEHERVYINKETMTFTKLLEKIWRQTFLHSSFEWPIKILQLVQILYVLVIHLIQEILKEIRLKQVEI